MPLLPYFPAGLSLRGTKLNQNDEKTLNQNDEKKINISVDIQNRKPSTNCCATNTFRSAMWPSGGDPPGCMAQARQYGEQMQVQFHTATSPNARPANRLRQSFQLPAGAMSPPVRVERPRRTRSAESPAKPEPRVTLTQRRWLQSYESLKAMPRKDGQPWPPKGHKTAHGVDLSRWVVRQRGAYSVGKLSAEHVALLDALPGWVWSRNAEAWGAALAALELFVLLHGTMPTFSQCVLGYPVGTWVRTQRADFRAGRLSAERVAILEAVPGWVWNARDATWAAALQQLIEFRDEHGHLDVPCQYVSDRRTGAHAKVRLGGWVGYQRSKYLSGQLSERHKADLNAIAGWEWRKIPSS